MSNFLEASRLKLRFSTAAGYLSVEQLWDLSLTKLAAIAKGAKKALQGDNADNDLDFLDETKTVNKEDQLRFDVVKEIYLIKKAEANAAKTAAENKAHNEEIMRRIKAKQEQKLDNLTEEELTAMLK